MYFEGFFGGENEVHNIVHEITFGFSKLVFQEKGINVLDSDPCLYRMHYLHMSDCFKCRL